MPRHPNNTETSWNNQEMQHFRQGFFSQADYMKIIALGQTAELNVKQTLFFLCLSKLLSTYQKKSFGKHKKEV